MAPNKSKTETRSAVRMVDLALYIGKHVETLRYWRVHKSEVFPTFREPQSYPPKSNRPWWVPLETALLVARSHVDGFKGFPEHMVKEIKTK